tara:strand:+ start:6595 stop:7611 length:1017 start_codon:yes stop_codon:yes gene_type:complete
MKMQRRALVTGGCGFIGSNLSKRLVKEGWIVDIVDDMTNGHLELLDSSNIRVVPVDLLNMWYQQNKERPSDTILVIQGDFSHSFILDNIKDKKYDIIFHQAAVPRVSYSVEFPSLTTEENLLKYVKLIESARGNVKRVVSASSSSVYGGAEDLPTLETAPKNPKSPYALQKSALEDFSKLFCELYDIDIVCLRYFNVFGPGQVAGSPYATAVASWCHAIKSGTQMRSDGDGSQTRDLCYVDNVVDANIKAAISEIVFAGKSYNICCGDRTSNREILNFLKEKYSESKVVDAPWRAGDVMHTQGDWSSAKNDFGYSPIVKFWDGLNRTIEWWGLEDDNL